MCLSSIAEVIKRNGERVVSQLVGMVADFKAVISMGSILLAFDVSLLATTPKRNR